MPRAEGAELDLTAIALAAGVVAERWPEPLFAATMSPRAIRPLAIKASWWRKHDHASLMICPIIALLWL
jgi:hypothetical protein